MAEQGGQEPIWRVDNCLVMDDIIEKLHLLDYTARFCRQNQRKPITRTFFAIPEVPTDENMQYKVAYMVELCYWLLSLSFEDLWKKENRRKGKAVDKARLRNPYSDVRFAHFSSESDAINRLLQDLQKFKVHLPENF